MSRFRNLEFDEEERGDGADAGDVFFEETIETGEGVTGVGAPEMERAVAAHRAGSHDEALRWYSRVLGEDAVCEAAWVGQVRVLVELGEFREARMWATKGLERVPDGPDLLAARAVAHGRLGEASDALGYSDAAMEQPGESVYRWLARGDVLVSGRLGDGEACFRRARVLAGDDLFWLGALSATFLQLGLGARAMETARREVELGPGDATSWLNLARAQHAMGWLDDAEASLRSCRQLRPGDAGAERLRRQLAETGGVRRWWLRLRTGRGRGTRGD